ncbi:MAG: sulfatase family protein [Candidatus Sumerlaeaceae bacterium]
MPLTCALRAGFREIPSSNGAAVSIRQYASRGGFVSLCLFFLAGAVSPVLAGTKERPNIVLIISDDHRWDCIGAAGNPHVKTPNLDQLARDGVYFEQATIHTPQCSPCRASLLTGLPPHQNGWYSNQTQQRRVHAPNGFSHLPTVPGLLQKNGYRTVLVGKWHLKPEPWNVGFSDVRTWLPGGGGPYKDVRLAHGKSRQVTTTTGYLQDVLGQDAAEFISSPDAKEKPFFLWMALTAPHTPLRPNPEHLQALYAGKKNAQLAPKGFTRGSPEEQFTSFTVYAARKAAKATKEGKGAKAAKKAEPGKHGKAGKKKPETDWHDYYAAVSSADEQVGRVRDALKKAQLDQNTIVVFLGDNGMMRGSRGWDGKVLPYEESVRVPMLVYSPGFGSYHGKSTAAVSSLDLPPTFLYWANVGVPTEWPGRDLLNAMNAPTGPGFEHSFSEFADNVSPKFGPLEYRLVRMPDAKLIRWSDPAKGEEFFDLKNDPRELNNQIANAAYAEKIKGLRERLDEWQKRTADKNTTSPSDLVSGEGED